MTFFQKLRYLLTRRDKKILILILTSTVFISFLEVATLSFTMFFIGAITNFKKLPANKYIVHLFKYTGTLTSTQIILLFGSFLICFYLFRCAITVLHTYYLQRFFENRKHIFTFRFFQNYLKFNYHEFTSKNPASISKLIFTDAENLTTVVAAGIKIFAEATTMLLIYLSLALINWKMTLVLTFVLCGKVVLLIKTLSRKLAQQGGTVALRMKNINKLFNESFRNFKLVKLLGHESYMLSRFTDENKPLIRAKVLNKTLREIPRVLLETIGFTIMVGAVVYVVYKVKTPEYIIPILSMYALAFYRFMPSTTRIMQAYNEMVFAKNTVDLSSHLMYQTEKLGNKKINFNKKISLKDLSFSYIENKNIFTSVSLDLNKRERIAFIGESGSGKSTLADIIMGFYLPKNGKIFIDDTKLTEDNLGSWRSKIGYIPQQIYLFDGTVAENIVFGRKYNKEKIIEALKKANVYDFLAKEDGINTKVGEGGVRLSGGQMQRIAIARALYSDPEILVLDEATSALDNETETNIMKEIYNLDKEKTLIIIAHRLSTVLKCEKVYRVENQKIYNVSKEELYQEYVNISQEPQPQRAI